MAVKACWPEVAVPSALEPGRFCKEVRYRDTGWLEPVPTVNQELFKVVLIAIGGQVGVGIIPWIGRRLVEVDRNPPPGRQMMRCRGWN